MLLIADSTTGEIKGVNENDGMATVVRAMWPGDIVVQVDATPLYETDPNTEEQVFPPGHYYVDPTTKEVVDKRDEVNRRFAATEIV